MHCSVRLHLSSDPHSLCSFLLLSVPGRFPGARVAHMLVLVDHNVKTAHKKKKKTKKKHERNTQTGLTLTRNCSFYYLLRVSLRNPYVSLPLRLCSFFYFFLRCFYKNFNRGVSVCPVFVFLPLRPCFSSALFLHYMINVSQWVRSIRHMPIPPRIRGLRVTLSFVWSINPNPSGKPRRKTPQSSRRVRLGVAAYMVTSRHALSTMLM